MKILLTADLHAEWRWYEWISGCAAELDLVCLAGDILDGFHPGGLTGQMLAIDRWCRALGTPLALCSGNHDANGDPLAAPELVALGERSDGERERLGQMFTAERWMDVLARDGVVTDGQSRLLESRSGAVVVTTIPYRLAGGSADSLWAQGAELRKEHGAPWMVLHHEPPAATAVGGRFGDPGIFWHARLRRPDFVVSGHIHSQPYVGDFADRIGATWCFNAGQVEDTSARMAACPNHIILDLRRHEAIWKAAVWGGGRMERGKALV